MSYQSIVTFAHDPATAADMIAAAAGVAQTHDAHLSVMALGIDVTQPGAYYAGAQAIALQETLEIAKGEALEIEKIVQSTLGVWQVPWDCMPMTAQFGSLGYVVADRAQFSDLIVLPKPYGGESAVEDVAIIEAALFRTRVPVLVLPHGRAPASTLKSAVIAWNQSPEALAAVRAAIPLLRTAKSVDIAIIDPPAHGPDRSDPGGGLAEMLSRHGVNANVSVLAKTMARVSDVLERHCKDREAELLVMGAYGHSRLREAILGGATRNTLESTDIPVLMAH